MTWLLPVHNAMPYLPQTLASLADQTHPADRVLAWDDGSTDGTGDVLSRWLPSRLPGHVVGRERITLGPALRRLLEASRTPLVARIDGDDLAMPDRLAHQVEAMRSDPGLVLVGGQAQTIDAQGQVGPPRDPLPTSDRDCRWSLRFTNPFMHPAVLMRRSAALRAGNYAQTTRDQDAYLWARMARLGRMINLDRPVIAYRQHASSVTQAGARHAAHDRRRRWEALSPWLLPGIDRAQALRLLRLLADREDLAVTVQDVASFRRSVRCAGEACAGNAGYFAQTSLCRSQLASLRTRWWKSRSWAAAAWPVARTIRRGLAPRAA
ncbi:MAG: glycosyltransferase [Planctomycetota bacterium]